MLFRRQYHPRRSSLEKAEQFYILPTVEVGGTFVW